MSHTLAERDPVSHRTHAGQRTCATLCSHGSCSRASWRSLCSEWQFWRMSHRTRIRENVSHSGVLPDKVCETGGARPTCQQTVREKMAQNGGLIFCDGREAFRQDPSGGADCSHIHARAAALATARRRERRFQGSADHSGGCLALWSQFESGAGAQAKAPVSGNVRLERRMSRILGVEKKTKHYHEERFRRGRLRGFDPAYCKLQTRRPEKKLSLIHI